MDGAAILREVLAGDVPEVVALVTRTLAEFGLTFGEGSPTDAALLTLPGSYADVGGRFWVARAENGALLGCAGVHRLSETDVELRKMYLDPAARGMGVGRRLLDTAIAFARSRGARHLVLDTTEQMTRAIAFYERAGFVRDDLQRRGARCARGYRLDLE